MPCMKTTDGTFLFYEDWGAGAPVVLLHGWGVSCDMWEYQVPALTEGGLRCLAYDRRGSGRSDRPGTGYDYDSLAEDLSELLRHLDLREVTLVSHSMGGGEVVRYLAKHGQDRVARVALISPTLPFLLRTGDNPDGVDGGTLEHIVDALRADRPGFLAGMAAGALGTELPGTSVSDAMVQWAMGLFHSGSAQAAHACLRTHWESDLRADLAALSVPTLIVHGTHDALVPAEHTSLRLPGAIPDAELRMYENASHWLFVTHKERLNADLLAFCGASSGSSGA
ncbi:alpha/beta fold hydrolase [Streptomyces iconiensis]|uniref:Alpha/beta hydrolase n=1 Tax=Streptomyces iconiensis TaxID=1384038 RepID=A0ABT7A394_9ACTN|nr:alpha/beta hydrolase [Streptomyces iconiensis]MDJ1135799.1 alpha/beta hydrolase [Streptomyces iconiensis]